MRTTCNVFRIEGKFGQGKNGYNLNYIRAKRVDTSEAWINSIFLVMNLLILLRIFFALCAGSVVALVALFLPTKRMLSRCWDARRVFASDPEWSPTRVC